MRLCLLRLLFFFFKQKTAYEMRISDWSSDVCSSDLDSLHALAFEWLCDPVTSSDPFVRGELFCELARAAGPAGMAGGQMMDLAAETSNFDLPSSAQHTSELPSLLRISFAVFLLTLIFFLLLFSLFFFFFFLFL